MPETKASESRRPCVHSLALFEVAHSLAQVVSMGAKTAPELTNAAFDVHRVLVFQLV
jgi:hypothetical protein